MQVKKRWDGKTIVDLFADEFRQRPHEYYVQAVECGRIRVDGKIVSPSYIVHDSQKLSHFVHRHEPPVMAESVTILEEGVDVITVCKPASIPVHACGQYRKNTVVGILQAEHNNIGPLFPVHRLDRLVSGLLILARNVHTANFFRQEVHNSPLYNTDDVVGKFINCCFLTPSFLTHKFVHIIGNNPLFIFSQEDVYMCDDYCLHYLISKVAIA
jgi:tRNA pseudouridine synthase 9